MGAYSTFLLIAFVVLLICINPTLQADRLPSTGEIDDYNDPVLKEIFATPRSVVSQPPPSFPQPRQQPTYSERSLPAGEIPIHRGFQVGQYGSGSSSAGQPYNTYNGDQRNYNSDMSGLNQLAAQGAQTFYTGVQQAGQIFGFNFG